MTETKYAPAERLTKEEINNQYKELSSITYLEEIINALSHIALIINENRQVIISNNILLEMLGIRDIVSIRGMRPGELINCIHSSEMPGGCGTAESCRYCDALAAVMESQKLGKKVSRESTIISMIENEEIQFDLQVTSTPFNKNGTNYYIVTMDDISSEKRKRYLERLFFHDIINTIGGLKGMLDFLMGVDDEKKTKRLLNFIQEAGNRLYEEIIAQRDLMDAENKDLHVNRESLNSIKVINDAVSYLNHHKIAEGKQIIIADEAADRNFVSDERLLNRVLINMLKNALEASAEDEKVTINCMEEMKHITFTVHNGSCMDPRTQSQLFQRSFSTKGENRGLGTYSMKLFTEEYLEGKLTFSSNEKEGTVFSVQLPVEE